MKIDQYISSQVRMRKATMRRGELDNPISRMIAIISIFCVMVQNEELICTYDRTHIGAVAYEKHQSGVDEQVKN